MSDLRNSVAFLFFFLLLILGAAQARFIERYVLDFSPVFFVLLAVAVLSGILVRPARLLTIYTFLAVWAVVYGLLWIFLWSSQGMEELQLHIIQFTLLLISAGLAFDVSRQITMVAGVVRGLTTRTYPNRTIDLTEAEDRISAELTRSRRYHHPLSLLVLEVGHYPDPDREGHRLLQRDILKELAAAKVGQIIHERARETDLIMRDPQGRFLVLCPETTHENSITLARRIQETVSGFMGADVIWGSAFFPGEALTFEDLVQKAEARLDEPVQVPLPAAVDEPVDAGEKSPG